MRPPTAPELLDAWERGQGQPAVRRALALLAAACPDAPADDLARLPVGARDGLLLTLREWTFGRGLTALVDCPHCGEGVEMTFQTGDIRCAGEEVPEGGLSLAAAGFEVRFRLPDSRDLAAAAGAADVAGGRAVLLERCVLSAVAGGEAFRADRLPEAVVEAVVERMARADPQAEVRLDARCQACGAACPVAFDILSFFWAELEAWARRTLAEVHVLASAYGWRESDVLALSPFRRQMYLEMVNG
jgi:hypothetical protein